MRNRDPLRENVENILAICHPIRTMQYNRKSTSASHAISLWGHYNRKNYLNGGGGKWKCQKPGTYNRLYGEKYMECTWYNVSIEWSLSIITLVYSLYVHYTCSTMRMWKWKIKFGAKCQEICFDLKFVFRPKLKQILY